MSMSITPRSLKLLIVLLGISVLTIVYFTVFNPALDERERLKDENMNLTQEYNRLNALAAKSGDYEQKTGELEKENEVIISRYPSYLQIENEIMTVATLEDDSGSFFSTINIAEPVAVSDAANDGENASSDTSANNSTQDGAATDNTTETKSVELAGKNFNTWELYVVATALEFNSGYGNLKKMIKGIVDSGDRRSIEVLNAKYDSETGSIVGTLSFDSYFIYGLDKPYEEADIPSIKHGTDNVFGTPDTAGNK